ncbi:MAG: phytoene desaturase family protein [Chitinispirillaceae bacterium]|nr:phytoene desaturase family protein [Chitinispirillaceae bacterium]
MKKSKKVAIVGAGPGGLTAGMILAHHGFEVEIYEKNSSVGGRNGAIVSNGFKFDIGPTFLMLKPVLDEMFTLAGENINNHLEFYELDPMYHLVFKNRDIRISKDHDKTREQIKKLFPGEEKGFDWLLKREKKRFEAAYPCLKKNYSKFYMLFNSDLLKFLPRLSFPNSMFDELTRYFRTDDLKISFTFQSKYLGMSPWECPAAYMIIPYIEHNFGIQHVKGGLSEISEAMKKVFLNKGGKLYLNSEVVDIKKGRITLKNGESVLADEIVINADVGYAMKYLLKSKDLSNKDFSCSTFMLYLGIDRELDLEHHTIFFSDDYKTFVNAIFKEKKVKEDISFYIRNASKLDKSLAPAGCSNIYVLVPVPNNKSKIDWQKEKAAFRKLLIKKINEKIGIDIEKHIVFEHIITPYEWENEYNVFLGATFNLAHKLNQMLYFRPHNELSDGIYLVGGGTHPGSGLATIYESGRITSDIILKKHKIK